MSDPRVISLHQPRASLLVHGIKTIETRSRPTHVRGRVLIHATQRRVLHDAALICGDSVWTGRRETFPDQMLVRGVSRPGRTDYVEGGSWFDLPYGAIIGSAVLTDCLPIVETGEEGAIRTLDRDSDGSLWIVEPYDDEVDGAEPDLCDVSDQVPYGDFTPGRWGWIFADAEPVEERCPVCWGEGRTWDVVGNETRERSCLMCDPSGRCAPIPAKGRQGWWRWTP